MKREIGPLTQLVEVYYKGWKQDESNIKDHHHYYYEQNQGYRCFSLSSSYHLSLRGHH